MQDVINTHVSFSAHGLLGLKRDMVRKQYIINRKPRIRQSLVVAGMPSMAV